MPYVPKFTSPKWNVASLVSIIIALVTAAIWMEHRFSVFESRLGQVEQAVRSVWRVRDMDVWTRELKIMNPSLVIPDPRKVQQGDGMGRLNGHTHRPQS